MIYYILEGEGYGQDDGSEKPFFVLGIYESSDKADDAKDAWRKYGWKEFCVTPYKLNHLPA